MDPADSKALAIERWKVIFLFLKEVIVKGVKNHNMVDMIRYMI